MTLHWDLKWKKNNLSCPPPRRMIENRVGSRQIKLHCQINIILMAPMSWIQNDIYFKLVRKRFQKTMTNTTSRTYWQMGFITRGLERKNIPNLRGNLCFIALLGEKEIGESNDWGDEKQGHRHRKHYLPVFLPQGAAALLFGDKHMVRTFARKVSGGHLSNFLVIENFRVKKGWITRPV